MACDGIGVQLTPPTPSSLAGLPPSTAMLNPCLIVRTRFGAPGARQRIRCQGPAPMGESQTQMDEGGPLVGPQMSFVSRRGHLAPEGLT